MLRRTFISAVGAAVATHPAWASDRPRLKIGQIGTTHAHASGKMLALRAQPEHWEVVGIAEPDTERRPGLARAKAYQGLPVLSEEALLAMRDVKAIVVETGIEDACATALRAIRAGKHVHLDKPGAIDHAEFRRMRREAENRELIVQMGYMLRYNPAFELLFQAVRDGWLGEITSIDAEMGKLGGKAEMAAIAALEGGGMFELGCHLIDLIVALLGPPQSVHAFSTPSGRQPGVKDNQLAVLQYARATATVRTNFVDPFGGPRRRFNVTGTEGTLEILPLESGQVRLSLSQPRGSYKAGAQAIEAGRGAGRYDGEFADLARVLNGEKSFAWSADHDIAVHETVLRASGVWGW